MLQGANNVSLVLRKSSHKVSNTDSLWLTAIISFEKNLISTVFYVRRWNWTIMTSSGHWMLMLPVVCKVNPDAYFPLWNFKTWHFSRLGQNPGGASDDRRATGEAQAVDSQTKLSSEWLRKLISRLSPVLGRLVKGLQLVPLWFHSEAVAAAVAHCFSKWHHCTKPSVCTGLWDS